nr:THAP domain-containing protein 6 isoform X4 [Peromyscus maniculatus bairdii]
MVKCCSAIGCASRCLPNSKLKGLTFHVFPTDENIKRKWVLAMKRLDVNAAGIWEPKKGDVLCSRHFKKTDFDRSAPNTKLKPGVIPSVFESPHHSQEKREKLHCRKNFILKTLPVTNHGHQLVDASCIEEFQSQFIFGLWVMPDYTGGGLSQASDSLSSCHGCSWRLQPRCSFRTVCHRE